MRSPTREKYLRWIATAFPRYLEAYQAAYARGAYLGGAYRRPLLAMFERLRARHGFSPARKAEPKQTTPPPPRQLVLW